ncbi:MAG TPA: FmdB family zinc ribbon protein [Actinomycetota bacterium]|jgi:putative FmdB family regulatory protein|nr:FmdB family zinc ribbon protein [Actinomycetota bacterium]
MPTYEYACTECGDRTEVVQSFSDAPPTTCPVCGGVLRRVFSPVGIVFKGSGFYRTDSRGKPSSGKADGRGDGADKAKKAADNSSGSKSSSSDGASSGSTTKAAEKSA